MVTGGRPADKARGARRCLLLNTQQRGAWLTGWSGCRNFGDPMR